MWTQQQSIQLLTPYPKAWPLGFVIGRFGDLNPEWKEVEEDHSLNANRCIATCPRLQVTILQVSLMWIRQCKAWTIPRTKRGFRIGPGVITLFTLVFFMLLPIPMEKQAGKA